MSSTLTEESNPLEDEILRMNSPARKVSFSTLSEFSSPDDELLQLVQHNRIAISNYPLTGSMSEHDIRRISNRINNPYPTPQADSPPGEPKDGFMQGGAQVAFRRRASEPEFKRRASLGMEATLQRYLKTLSLTDNDKRLIKEKQLQRPASPEVRETQVGEDFQLLYASFCFFFPSFMRSFMHLLLLL